MNINNDYCASYMKNGTWIVKLVCSSHISSVHDTQASAWKEARRLARAMESKAFLKDRNGEIKTQNSYSHKSCRPKQFKSYKNH
jgi:hypothetical protein